MHNILALDLGRHNQKTHGATFTHLGGRGPRLTCSTNEVGLTEVFQAAITAGVTAVYFEAQPSAFRVADLARAHGLKPVIANTHAEGFAARARSTKSDKLDVDRLGGMALRGDIVGIHIPDANDRDRRSLVELRASLVGDQTATKNRIRGLAEQHWWDLPDGEACWSKDGLASLRAKTKDRHCRQSLRAHLGILLDQLQAVAKQIDKADAALAQLREDTPEARRLIDELPGFGQVTTDAFMAFVGNPKKTGHSSRSAAAITGLAPTQRQSGKTMIPGPISKAGNATMRGYLVEAAHQAVIRYPEWRAMKERLTKGKDDPVTKGKAIVAVARRLAQTAAALLRSGKPYNPERIMPKHTWSPMT
jgi:transposase